MRGEGHSLQRPPASVDCLASSLPWSCWVAVPAFACELWHFCSAEWQTDCAPSYLVWCAWVSEGERACMPLLSNSILWQLHRMLMRPTCVYPSLFAWLFWRILWLRRDMWVRWGAVDSSSLSDWRWLADRSLGQGHRIWGNELREDTILSHQTNTWPCQVPYTLDATVRKDNPVNFRGDENNCF